MLPSSLEIRPAAVAMRFARASFADALAAMWRELQLQDDQLADLPESPEGAYEFAGGRLRVRCVGRTQDCIALEVTDLPAQRIWECGFGNAGSFGALGFYREVRGSGEVAPAWRRAEAALGPWEEIRPRVPPTFMAMASAYLGTSSPMVSTVAPVDLLADDLAYWKQLALTQGRLLKRGRVPNRGLSSASEARGEPADPAEQRQWELRELDEWAALNEERITVLPRAIAAAKRSTYATPATAYAALEFLAGPYRDVKLGIASRDVLAPALAQLGLSIGGSVDPSRAGEAGWEYFVRWRGRRRFLDQHLSKGVSRDPRFMLRVYFTWNEEDGRAIVGWLPSHLSNSLS